MNNIIKKILKLFKEACRWIIILFLLLFSLIYFVDKNFFGILFLLCILLLIPKFAILLYNKYRVNRKAKYGIIIVLFFVAMFNVSSDDVYGESRQFSSEEIEKSNDKINEAAKENNEKSNESKNKDVSKKDNENTKKNKTVKKDKKSNKEKNKDKESDKSINKEENKPVVFDEGNINKNFTCDGKKVTIKKMSRVTKSQLSYVPDGKEWIGIYIVFENISGEDIGYYETDFNLVNSNGEVIKPMFNVIKGAFDHERFNSGKLVDGGIHEGYVIFSNDIISDKKLSLRYICEDNWFTSDVIKTVKLYS